MEGDAATHPLKCWNVTGSAHSLPHLPLSRAVQSLGRAGPGGSALAREGVTLQRRGEDAAERKGLCSGEGNR